MGSLIFYNPDTNEVIGEIEEIKEIRIESSTIDETIQPFSLQKEAEFIIEGHIIDRNQTLSFLYGKRITNNFLKLHGGVMKRRYKYKKCHKD